MALRALHLVALVLFLAASAIAGSHEAPEDNSNDLSNEFFYKIKQLLAAKLSLSRKENDNFARYWEAEKELPSQSSSPPRPKEVEGWPSETLNVGQITAVSINSLGQPVIFHRGGRVWDESSFNASHHFVFVDEGPIPVDTVLVLDPNTGGVLSSWGSDTFYMPHGLTVDRHDNIWVTDVAMHQVFKFSPSHRYPKLTLGDAFHPGPSRGRLALCQPTSVAVASTGEVFVADGYCNNQVLEFNAAGALLRVIPRPPEFLSLQVPHSLALLEQLDLLCIADRENMRVACPRAGLRGPRGWSPPAAAHAPDLGRVFAVAALGDLVYAINGPTSPMIPVRGFTIDPRAESIIDHWAPAKGFTKPHSLAISHNGSFMYVTEIGPNKIWKFELVIDN